jgi:toxin ParE1/3/4
VRVTWLDRAVEDLKAVRNYIASDRPSAAAEVAQRLRDAVKLLADYPAAGRPGRVPHTRELVVAGTPYILPYRVRSESVEILRVLHGAQTWPET